MNIGCGNVYLSTKAPTFLWNTTQDLSCTNVVLLDEGGGGWKSASPFLCNADFHFILFFPAFAKVSKGKRLDRLAHRPRWTLAFSSFGTWSAADGAGRSGYTYLCRLHFLMIERQPQKNQHSKKKTKVGKFSYAQYWNSGFDSNTHNSWFWWPTTAWERGLHREIRCTWII